MRRISMTELNLIALPGKSAFTLTSIFTATTPHTNRHRTPALRDVIPLS
jgi:hypothetical protein